MKYLLIAAVLLLSSCTGIFNAMTQVTCPCTVVSVEKVDSAELVENFIKPYPRYYIVIVPTDYKVNLEESIGFYTTHLHQVGDTIK